MTPTSATRALCLLVLVVLAGCVQGPVPESASTPAVESETVIVTDVVDGDTMAVRYPDGRTDTIRLLGVDTPETHTSVSPGEFEGIPDTPAGRSWLRGWGQNASRFATERLAGRRVEIATDPAADRRGGYGRLLVYLSVDGTAFNRALLDRGYARLYDAPFSRRTAFADAEATAKRSGVGLWGFDGSEAPAATTRSSVPTDPPADGANFSIAT